MEVEEGMFLDMDDCKALYRGLRRNEADLSSGEQGILHRLERFLYQRLSIREIDELVNGMGGGGESW